MGYFANSTNKCNSYWLNSRRSENPESREKLPTGMAHSAIPGLFFLSVRRRPESLFLLRPRNRKGARSARIIHWIPAYAGMAEEGGNGREGFIRWMPAGFLHSLESRNPAYKARFALLLREEQSASLCNVRVPRSICAGFLLSSLCKNSENPGPREKISHWHGNYRPKTV